MGDQEVFATQTGLGGHKEERGGEMVALMMDVIGVEFNTLIVPRAGQASLGVDSLPPVCTRTNFW